jgi:hypothetical protein
MAKEPHVDWVPLPDQTNFKNSLQPGYSDGSAVILCKGPRWHLYLSIAGISKSSCLLPTEKSWQDRAKILERSW